MNTNSTSTIDTRPASYRGAGERDFHRRPKLHGLAFWRMAWVALIVASFGAVMFVGGYTGADPPMQLHAMLGAHLLLLALPFVVVSPAYSWTHPAIFASIIGLLTVLRRFPAYTWGLEAHQVLGFDKRQLESLLTFELLLTSIGVLAYYTVFALGRPSSVPILTFAKPRRLKLYVIAIVATTLALTAIYVARQGGLSQHFSSWQFGRHEQLSGSYYFIVAASQGLFACLVWWALDEKASRAPSFWICALLSLCISFVLNGSRSNLILTCVIALLVSALQRRTIAYWKLIFAAAVILIAIAELGELRRGALWGGESRDDSSNTSRALASLANGWQEMSERSTTSSGSLPVLAEVPDRVDYLYGRSYVAVLALPVPRAIWSGKPGMIGGEAGLLFFGLPAGVPVGPVAEAYWNFGIAGVVLAYGLFGLFHRWLLKFYEHYRSEPAVMLMYAIVLTLLTPSSVGLVDCLLWLVPVTALLWLFGAMSLSPPAGMVRSPGRSRSLFSATTQQR